jgi:hypothetical protein
VISKVTIVAATLLLAVLSAGTALAKPQGKWDAVSSGQQSLTSQIGAARTSDGVLHVAWQRRSGSNAYDLLHTGLSPSGQLSPARAIVTGWVGVQDAALLAESGSLSAWFTGQRSTDTFDPFIGLHRVASGDGGATWTAPSLVYGGANVYGRTPSVISGWGTPFQVWYDIGETVLHYGTASDGNLARLYPDGSARCCSYQQNIANNNSQAVVVWCSGVDAPNGIWWQQVSPTGAPFGVPRRLPESSTSSDGKEIRVCDAAGRVPLAVRAASGDFFVADSAGYPTANRILLWELGGGVRTVTAGGGEKRTVALAADPGGRLWLAWSRRDSNRLFFRRTNPHGLAFGAVVSVRIPQGQIEASELDISAQADRLDALARFSSATGAVTLFHTQVYPGLTLRASGVRVTTFRVTDAGDPVAGATIRVAGRTATTSSAGVATIDLPRGTFRATATKMNYTPASIRARGA